MRGRVDLARYATSLGKARNFITKPTGGGAKRPGTQFLGTVKFNDRKTRLIPFVYSNSVKYLIEMGDNYMRFWVDGALLLNGASVVEVATPYTAAMIGAVRFTQSADVLYLVHPQVAPHELRRLTINTFELRAFAFKRGPFRPFNNDEARVLAVSAASGVVTVTTNVDTFTAGMVGGLIYAEEKELRGVKPWTSAEKNIPLGSLRRSDSKVYRVVGVPPTPGSGGYYVTGGTRPTHNSGRAFDGGQDVKSDGVNDYAVGVEWEFVHNPFGLARIQSFTNARSVQALVIERFPDSIIGVAASPSNSWTFSGDGVQTQFAITGATSDFPFDYNVTINGTPVQSNPNYPGGGGVGDGGGGNPGPGNGDFPQLTP